MNFLSSLSLNEFVRHQNWDWVCVYESIDSLNAESHSQLHTFYAHMQTKTWIVLEMCHMKCER